MEEAKNYILYVLNQPVFVIFFVIITGYMLGRIRCFEVSLGSAGILLIALLFGHFGAGVPSILRDLGLICFVASVGMAAGPDFFINFKRNAKSYVVLGVLIVAMGALTCVGIIKLTQIPKELAVGLLTGALTSTPGLAAATEASGSQVAAVGYGIAYPFGVVSVVLFVQLMPALLNMDMKKGLQSLNTAETATEGREVGNLLSFDSLGLFAFSCVVVLGILIADIRIRLPGNLVFSLGTSGGPLLAGLIIGHTGRIGCINMSIQGRTLDVLKEFGMIMFLVGAGTQAGAGFVEILTEHGGVLFLYGAAMAIIPMTTGFAVAFAVLRLSPVNSLGSICGGMTSTPALGTLVEVTKSNDVVTAYAATYPIALVSVVAACQGIILYM